MVRQHANSNVHDSAENVKTEIPTSNMHRALLDTNTPRRGNKKSRVSDTFGRIGRVTQHSAATATARRSLAYVQAGRHSEQAEVINTVAQPMTSLSFIIPIRLSFRANGTQHDMEQTFVTGRKPRLERDGTGVIKWLEKARDGGLFGLALQS